MSFRAMRLDWLQGIGIAIGSVVALYAAALTTKGASLGTIWAISSPKVRALFVFWFSGLKFQQSQ